MKKTVGVMVVIAGLILGVSLAGARALASEEKKELWQSLAEEFFPGGTKEAPPLYVSRSEMLDLMRVMEVPRPPRRKGRPFPKAAKVNR